jgi:hypothetical protein
LKVNFLEQYKGKKYFNVSINNENANYVLEANENLKLVPLFKKSNNSKSFFRTNSENKLELLEITGEFSGKYGYKTLMKYHYNLDKTDVKLLFNRVYYPSPCFKRK